MKVSHNIHLFDFLSPTGHIAFNSHIIKTISSCGDYKVLMYVAKELFNQYEGLDVTLIPLPKLGRSRFLNLLRLLCFIFINSAHIKDSDRALILSYDIIFLPIIFYTGLIRDIDFLTIEHNTVLEPEEKYFKMKSFIHSLCKRVRRMCLSHTAVDLFKNISCEAYFIGHPLLAVPNTLPAPLNFPRVTVFAPSRNADLSLVCAISKSNPNIDVYIRSSKNSIVYGSNIYILDNMDYSHYLNFIRSSDFILIPTSFHSRVSGSFYEALSLKKKVLTNRSVLTQEYDRFFPNICFIDKNYKFEYCKDFISFNSDDWNNKFADRILGVIDVRL